MSTSSLERSLGDLDRAREIEEIEEIEEIDRADGDRERLIFFLCRAEKTCTCRYAIPRSTLAHDRTAEGPHVLASTSQTCWMVVHPSSSESIPTMWCGNEDEDEDEDEDPDSNRSNHSNRSNRSTQ